MKRNVKKYIDTKYNFIKIKLITIINLYKNNNNINFKLELCMLLIFIYKLYWYSYPLALYCLILGCISYISVYLYFRKDK